MEQHIESVIMTSKPSFELRAVDYFEDALVFAQTNYQAVIDRISNTRFGSVSAIDFWDEYVWAVYVSGFRAKTISKIWVKLLTAYDKLELIGEPAPSGVESEVRETAMKVFAHPRKTKAIIDASHIIRIGRNEVGWERFRDTNLSTPEQLQTLPFIGKITCYHLARNIGLLQYVKPDLHLVRMAKRWGFPSPQALCEYLAREFDMQPGIVDLVLWYSASTFGTKELDKPKPVVIVEEQ